MSKLEHQSAAQSSAFKPTVRFSGLRSRQNISDPCGETTRAGEFNEFAQPDLVGDRFHDYRVVDLDSTLCVNSSTGRGFPEADVGAAVPQCSDRRITQERGVDHRVDTAGDEFADLHSKVLVALYEVGRAEAAGEVDVAVGYVRDDGGPARRCELDGEPPTAPAAPATATMLPAVTRPLLSERRAVRPFIGIAAVSA